MAALAQPLRDTQVFLAQPGTVQPNCVVTGETAMSRNFRKQARRELVKLGYKTKESRALYWEFVYRQSKAMEWDSRPCYGVGLYQDHELVKLGFDYKQG